MENKYQNSKIYKIISPSNPELIYYGSTIQSLSKRMSKHKDKSNTCVSKEIIKLGDAEIILIEEYPCNNKNELHLKETEYIKNNNCINKNINTPRKERYKQWIAKNPDYQKQYQELYREKRKLITI